MDGLGTPSSKRSERRVDLRRVRDCTRALPYHAANRSGHRQAAELLDPRTPLELALDNCRDTSAGIGPQRLSTMSARVLRWQHVTWLDDAERQIEHETRVASSRIQRSLSEPMVMAADVRAGEEDTTTSSLKSGAQTARAPSGQGQHCPVIAEDEELGAVGSDAKMGEDEEVDSLNGGYGEGEGGWTGGGPSAVDGESGWMSSTSSGGGGEGGDAGMHGGWMECVLVCGGYVVYPRWFPIHNRWSNIDDVAAPCFLASTQHAAMDQARTCCFTSAGSCTAARRAQVV